MQAACQSGEGPQEKGVVSCNPPTRRFIVTKEDIRRGCDGESLTFELKVYHLSQPPFVLLETASDV
jgi:hypothetical protein